MPTLTPHETDPTLGMPPLLVPSADAVAPDHPSQWWYWSGQLRSATGRRYGFQAAFFAAEAIRGLLWGQMAHWALVDLDARRFASGSRLWLGAPQRIEGRFALASPGGREGVAAWGGGGHDRLRLRVPELDLDLQAGGGPLALHYAGEAHAYAFGGYSYYYSRPKQTGVGLLTRAGRSEQVRGDVWFDRQFGDLTPALAEGWQWLSIHLERGEQLMVFGFNRTPAERFASITDAGGVTRWLRGDELGLEPIDHWRSDASGIVYPCAWRLTTPDHALEIRASLRGQEMTGARWWGPVYWEGACEVSGSQRGLAYVELLGSLAPALARWTALAHERESSMPARWLARSLRHPTLALGLATGVARLAAGVDALRPEFPGLTWPTPSRRRDAGRKAA